MLAVVVAQLIYAIGEVVYTCESKAKIDAACAVYDGCDVVVCGVGYGAATSKKPAFSWSVTVR